MTLAEAVDLLLACGRRAPPPPTPEPPFTIRGGVAHVACPYCRLHVASFTVHADVEGSTLVCRTCGEFDIIEGDDEEDHDHTP